MIKLEEKASWFLELENNDLFSRGNSDVDIVFEYQDWILILEENGGKLLTKSLIKNWKSIQLEFLIIPFLAQLPDEKEEFYSLVELIRNNDSFKVTTENQYYSSYIEEGIVNHLSNIIQYLDLKPFFNTREKLRFAIKKVYEDRFRFRTISTILLISLFFIIWIAVFVTVMWLLYPETLNYFEILEFGLLFYSLLGAACLVSRKQKNKKVSKLFDAIDNLGLEYFQLTDKDEAEFLSDNIKEENSSSIIYDIVEEMRKNKTINLVN